MKKFLMLFALLVIFSPPANSLNKIRWKDMNWQIYETAHFNVYYYEGNEQLAKLASVFAEKAYEHNTKILKFSPKQKTPLFVFEDHIDFSNNNISIPYTGEGTGGFTEAYKNRVVVPSTGSMKMLREVIYHELAHALQFDIIFGEGLRSYSALYKSLFVPMWIMEGMAEYCADDLDSRGHMVLRDAVINNRLIAPEMLDGFAHLEEVFLAYKQGTSLMQYIGKKYGEDKLAKIINMFDTDIGTETVIKKALKREAGDFFKEWEFSVKSKYWAQMQGRDLPGKYGPALTNANHINIIYNEGPVMSPDKSAIAFVSTREGQKSIYLMRPDGREVRRAFSNTFDSISSDGKPLSWSYDGKYLYFASKDKGKAYIIKGDVTNGSCEKIEVPGMFSLFSPAVSPDDKKLAFVGLKGGFTDIYVYDMEEKNVIKITDNIYANNSPAWSPDGAKLVFTEERADINTLVVFDVKKIKKETMTAKMESDCRTPSFLNEDEIIYASDKNGIFNIYSVSLKDKKEKQLTNVINGIFYPSVMDGEIYYSYYEDGCYNIYKYLSGREREFAQLPPADEAQKESLPPEAVKALKEIKKAGDIALDRGLAGDDAEYIENINAEFDAILIKAQKYETAFSLDLLFAIIGFSTDTGPVGTAFVTASDMLGDNNLSLLANFVPGYFSQFEAQYLFLDFPFDLSVSAFYYQNAYRLYDLNSGTFFSNLDTSEKGGSLSLKYPFSLYNSLTVSLLTDNIVDVYTNYNTQTSYLFEQNRNDILNSLSLFFVSDYSAWRDYWPYSGHVILAYMENAQKMFGGTREYSIYELDVRKYIDMSFVSMRNMSASVRGLFAMTEGANKPLFLFGGMNTVRGMYYGEYSGDKIALINAELRYTIAKNVDFNLWPFNFMMIKNFKIAFFDDLGLVQDGALKSVNFVDIKNGMGVSLIVDTFLIQRQYTPLKFEVAKRTDITDDNWKFYFSLNTNF